jgi:hypothetical protein
MENRSKAALFSEQCSAFPDISDGILSKTYKERQVSGRG